MDYKLKWYAALPLRSHWQAGNTVTFVYSSPGVCAHNCAQAYTCGQVAEVSPSGMNNIEVLDSEYESCGLRGCVQLVEITHVLSKQELAYALEEYYATDWCQRMHMNVSIQKVIDMYALQDVPGPEDVCDGYKALHSDMTAYDRFQYVPGKRYEMGGIVAPCNRGFHYCKRLLDVYRYYSACSATRIFTVRAWGRQRDTRDGRKSVATCIQLDKELSYKQIMGFLRNMVTCSHDEMELLNE